MIEFCAHEGAEALLLDDYVAWRGRQPIYQRRSWWSIHWYLSCLLARNGTNLNTLDFAVSKLPTRCSTYPRSLEHKLHRRP